ncbi:pyridoxamine 5'-phosphate oxidase family protein [Aureitalea marina]|uniref:Pyridoxamine 5'-phosphate oxidase Alr4036 family FMN-binding domain-containing protein n=1 Tax=Aureitalea marina TaxID=930804 RepID=A0A2S7KRS5_9FLAO|nr:pyridoxamine 5'-phosphate oxidase family protein [Aureitalea marina]PQB05288.1 hypothetical protein BST85_10640 [Aureitalea marina]
MELLTLAKAELKRSENDPSHPFRYFFLGTHARFPQVRTVVKRGLDDRLGLTFFTDSRTRKVGEIRQNDLVSALFYHPQIQLQIRLNGKASILSEDSMEYAKYFNQIQSGPHRKDYTTKETPGTPSMDESEIIYGETIHLTVIKISPHDLDVVQLGKTRHHRSHYERDGNLWIETKLVP